MLLIVPSLDGPFTVVDVTADASAPASGGSAVPDVVADEALGKPFSQLPQDTQQSLLAELPSSEGGLAVGSPNDDKLAQGEIGDQLKTSEL